MDSLRFENFALISNLFCLSSLFMGTGGLRLSLAKNIHSHTLISPVILIKNNFVLDKWFRLNDGKVIVPLSLFCFRILQRACLVSGVKF